MKQNIGTGDKIVRGILGLFLIYLASLSYKTSLFVSGAAFVFGFLLIVTSMFGFCFIYRIFNFSTKHSPENPGGGMQ